MSFRINLGKPSDVNPFTVHTGTALPLRRSDVDTDQIIPAVWLKRVERTGFGAGLFSAWRKDPGFVLNDTRYAGATVLLAGENFGTGSSREHAVWALTDYGFAAVLSPRFADIFRSNSYANGFLPVQLPEAVIERLMDAVEADPTTPITPRSWRHPALRPLQTGHATPSRHSALLASNRSIQITVTA